MQLLSPPDGVELFSDLELGPTNVDGEVMVPKVDFDVDVVPNCGVLGPLPPTPASAPLMLLAPPDLGIFHGRREKKLKKAP